MFGGEPAGDGDDDRARPWHLGLLALLVLAVAGTIYWATTGGGTKATALPAPASATRSPSPTPSASAGDGYGFEQRQADTAAAKKINLALHDMPTGWGQSAAAGDSSDTSGMDKQLADCLGEPGALANPDNVSVSSPNFSYATATMSSSVDFAHTAAAARHDLAILQKPTMADCLQQVMPQAFSRAVPGATLSSTEAQPLSMPAMGDGSSAYRIKLVYTVKGNQLPVYVDMLAFLAGRAEVTGIFSNVAIPLPGAVEQQMMNIMLGRATGTAGSSNTA